MEKLYDALRLCLITQHTQGSFLEYLSFIKHAIQGGVSMIQLRNKSAKLSELKLQACLLKETLEPFNVPLIINDHVELAAEIDAAGVHIGSQDMPAFEARRLLGPEKIIGLSIESMEDLEQSNEMTAINYVTASAVYRSRNKLDCKKIWGLEGLRQVVLNAKHPVTAIGNIHIDNVSEVIAAGAKGVAVIGAIHDHIDPHKAARELRLAIEKT